MIKGVKTLYNDPTVKNFKHILVHNDNERQENSIGEVNLALFVGLYGFHPGWR